MSNHSIMDNKQRLSTITTSAALSNNRRLKTTLTNQFNTMILGKDKKDRDHVIEHAGTFSIIKGDWKYIEPSKGAKMSVQTNTELGNDPQPQLYNLAKDIGEKNNVAVANWEKVKELEGLLKEVKEK